jgi:hypothetical protein
MVVLAGLPVAVDAQPSMPEMAPMTSTRSDMLKYQRCISPDAL